MAHLHFFSSSFFFLSLILLISGQEFGDGDKDKEISNSIENGQLYNSPHKEPSLIKDKQHKHLTTKIKNGLVRSDQDKTVLLANTRGDEDSLSLQRLDTQPASRSQPSANQPDPLLASKLRPKNRKKDLNRRKKGKDSGVQNKKKKAGHQKSKEKMERFYRKLERKQKNINKKEKHIKKNRKNAKLAKYAKLVNKQY